MKTNWAYYISGRKIGVLKQNTTTLEYETSDESDALAVAICHASSNIISQLVIKE